VTIKTILIALNEVGLNDQILAASAELAIKFDAHIVGLYVIPAAEVYPIIGESLSTQVYAGHRDYYIEQSGKVKQAFESQMALHGVKCEWRKIDVKSSLVADGVMPHCFHSDLIIVPQKPEKLDLENLDARVENDFTERVIMESGRPVLIIPTTGEFSGIGQQVVIGWNGTREAARSAFYAIPFMKEAKNVTIAWVNAQSDLPGSELATCLSRHGITTTTRSVEAADASVGEELLSTASNLRADLLVMGGYGHSRLREFILGGATRTVLDKMTIPVLMSH